MTGLYDSIGSMYHFYPGATATLYHFSVGVYTRQTVHAVHDHRVPLAREAQQGIELGTRDILARCLVGEGAVHGNLLELAIRVLVERADPDIADPLSIHGSISSICQDRVCKVRGRMSRKRISDPKLTGRR